MNNPDGVESRQRIAVGETTQGSFDAATSGGTLYGFPFTNNVNLFPSYTNGLAIFTSDARRLLPRSLPDPPGSTLKASTLSIAVERRALASLPLSL